MDKEVLRELMAHAEFETTDFYYIHVSEERKNKEFERVNFEQFQGKSSQNKGKTFTAKRKNKNSQSCLRVWCSRRNSNPRPLGS